MSDLFGLLPLPAPVPMDGKALTDPALDLLLDFLKAVINDDLGAAWASRTKADPTPVAHVFNHNPDLESFNANQTPALYGWRSDDNGSGRYSQDLTADESGFSFLWVPPPASQENRREREGIFNGIKKSIKAALLQGRHPAWVLAGDTYFEPEDYGTVLLPQLKIAKLKLGTYRAHELVIESEDGGFKQPYQCIFFVIEALEFNVRDESDKEGFTTLDHIQGTMSLPAAGDQIEALDVQDFHFEFELTAPVAPTTGTGAGGEVITITGKQFIDVDYEVRFGTTLSPEVIFVDESTITAKTPAHAVGAVDLSVLAPTGIEKTLLGAFTYV